MGKFQDYILYKENNIPVVSKVKLTKAQGAEDFQPFVIDKDSHSNLRILVKAFENSPQVGVGYTTMDKTNGEVEPKLKKKLLYLTGGAVRDHLKGKTPRNYDLVTDATSSEIKLILKGNGFEESQNPKGNKSFFPSRRDSKNKPIEFTVVVNGEGYELSPLSKSIKNRNLNVDGFSATSSLEDDAAARDFTINAMYIPLKNSEGENTELLDVYGGAHHLKNGQIVSIGKFSKRVDEDPVTAHRYLRMQARYGNGELPEDHIESLSKINDVNKNYKREYILGLENPEVNDKKYLDMYNSTGLINTIYPMDNLSLDVPEKAYNDRFLTSAWVVKDNPMEKVKFALLSAGWEPREVDDIAHLVGMYQAERNNYPAVSSPCGLSDNKVNRWRKMYSTSAW
jgi:tRNA nucleotidyltransferase/poly(A) polymerase